LSLKHITIVFVSFKNDIKERSLKKEVKKVKISKDFKRAAEKRGTRSRVYIKVHEHQRIE
jgi:hypothetical protein